MKLTKSVVLTLIALATVATGAIAMDHSKSVFTAAGDVQFEDIIPGVVAFGTVTGDRAKGSHGTFVRIPAGQATPLHTHSSEYHAVIIQGNMENPITDDDVSNATLTAGSYYYVPAGAKHVTRCAADSPVDCISYFYQAVPFDFSVAE